MHECTQSLSFCPPVWDSVASARVRSQQERGRAEEGLSLGDMTDLEKDRQLLAGSMSAVLKLLVSRAGNVVEGFDVVMVISGFVLLVVVVCLLKTRSHHVALAVPLSV